VGMSLPRACSAAAAFATASALWLASRGSLRAQHLFHGNPDEPCTLFWEHEGNRAFRQGEWKLVAVHGGPWELYDLGKDRTELSNLATARPDRVRALSLLYDEWAARSGVKPWSEPQTPIGGRR
jgi:arylsulfatase A-like enzyme